HLPLEPSRREGEGGEARYHRVGRVDRQVQLHPPVRAGGGVEVDGAERGAAVVRRDPRQPVPLGGQPAREHGDGLAGQGQRPPAAACPEAVAPTPTGSRATGAGAVGSVVADSVMAGAGAPSSMPAVRAPMAANPTSTRANASATTQPSCSAASARARPTSLAK